MYGVGPAYVAIIMIATTAGIFLSKTGRIAFAATGGLKIIFMIFGIALLALAVFMWLKAVIFDRIDRSIAENRLFTGGIYACVRNPIYSAFLFLCTGAILICGNALLFPLPFLYWLFLTVLMKNTEEKWLLDLYGQEYTEYCRMVNRCIPRFRR